MNPVSDLTGAVKSAWRPRNLLLLLLGLLGLFALANWLGLTDWILKPVDNAKRKWNEYKADKAAVLFVFATAAAATATNALML